MTLTTIGFVLVALGILTVCGGFTYAAYNMKNAFQDPTNLVEGNTFSNHGKAIFVVAIGGMLAVIGGLTLAAHYLLK